MNRKKSPEAGVLILLFVTRVSGTFVRVARGAHLAVFSLTGPPASPLSRHRSINLSAPLLLEGYRRGLFPMALEDGEIGWFSPDPRGIIPLESEGFHIPHGLRRFAAEKCPFDIRMNSAFESVIRACARRSETWISEEIIRSPTATCTCSATGTASSAGWTTNSSAGCTASR